MSTLGDALQPDRPSEPRRKAEAALTKAAAHSNPEHKMGDALIGIGWALLHLAEVKRR